jgi:hypothetical protein
MSAMTIVELLASLDLPLSCRVDQRVPKKLLVENGAPTAADKRRINEGIEEIQWLAALKPNTIGVPDYSDDIREYLEIALITVTLRSEAKPGRLVELIHRAIPYPLVLVMSQGGQTTLSLAHKRRAQNEAGRFVLDDNVVEVTIHGDSTLSDDVKKQFLLAMAIGNQPRANLLLLYQGWVDTLVALQAAQITRTFAQAATDEAAIARRDTVQKCRELEMKINALRNTAVKETQMRRRVELNLEIKGLDVALAEAKGKL